MNDQDGKIILAALMRGIWPRNFFMIKLARKTLTSLREFIDRVDDYVNVKDTLRALIVSKKMEMEQASRASHRMSSRTTPNKARKSQHKKRQDEKVSSQG